MFFLLCLETQAFVKKYIGRNEQRNKFRGCKGTESTLPSFENLRAYIRVSNILERNGS